MRYFPLDNDGEVISDEQVESAIQAYDSNSVLDLINQVNDQNKTRFALSNDDAKGIITSDQKLRPSVCGGYSFEATGTAVDSGVV